MFYIGKDNEIRITKGDSAAVVFTFSGDSPGEDDTVTLEVKKSINGTAVIQKTLPIDSDGNYTFSLVPSDTNNLVSGSNYRWDMRIKYSDGSIITPIKPSVFMIMDVVTDG